MNTMKDIASDVIRQAVRSHIIKKILNSRAGPWVIYITSLYLFFGVGFCMPPSYIRPGLLWTFIVTLLTGPFFLFLAEQTLSHLHPRTTQLRVVIALLILLTGTFFSHGSYAYSREQSYQYAMACMKDHSYTQAMDAFQALEDYRDSQQKAADCQNYALYESALNYLEKYPVMAYRVMFGLRGFAPADEMLSTPAFQSAREASLAVGESVKLGSYPHEETALHSGREPEPAPIEWIILARESDKALLLSQYVLDMRTFHQTKRPVTWADSTIRQWLNDDFITSSFAAAEQSVIEVTDVDSSDGNDATQDCVFLLSYDELHRYMPDSGSRIASATNYVTSQYGANRICSWLLRRTGKPGSSVPCIDYNGMQRTIDATFDPAGIRPAMWVTLDPDFF